MNIRPLALWLTGTAVVLVTGNAIENDQATANAGLACLPTTLGVLVLLCLLRPSRLWMVFVACAWGALGAGEIAGFLNDALGTAELAVVNPGPALDAAGGFEAALVEELLKVAGVVALVAAVRGRGITLVDGLLLGAAAGVGFNFSESAAYLADDWNSYGLTAAADDWFSRQVLGSVAGHASYSALAGAGVAAWPLLWAAWQRVAAAWSGLAAAIGSHFAWDAWGVNLWAPAGFAGTVVSDAETVIVDSVTLAFAVGLLILARPGWLRRAPG